MPTRLVRGMLLLLLGGLLLWGANALVGAFRFDLLERSMLRVVQGYTALAIVGAVGLLIWQDVRVPRPLWAQLLRLLALSTLAVFLQLVMLLGLNALVYRNYVVQKNFGSVAFTGLNLSGVDLSGGSFIGADFTGTNLSNADLTGATLVDANLTGVNLSGATLIGADLRGAFFQGANLQGANLSTATLARAEGGSANLSGANLFSADFTEANLQASDLGSANAMRAQFIGADLRGATLAGADLRAANLTGIIPTSPDWLDANAVTLDEQTLLPNGTPWTRNR